MGNGALAIGPKLPRTRLYLASSTSIESAFASRGGVPFGCPKVQVNAQRARFASFVRHRSFFQ